LKTNRLLAGTLALVLIAGLSAPAFANSGITEAPPSVPETISSSDVLTASEADNVVYDNGGDPNLGSLNLVISGPWTAADDFVIEEDTIITDFHFVLETFESNFAGTFEFFIFSDGVGQPGEILDSGIAIDVVVEQIEDSRHANVLFFLEEPFEAEGGVTYWFGLHTDDVDDTYAWDHHTNAVTGANACNTNEDPADGFWLNCGLGTDNWFLLTGHPPDVVGGEFLPIDSTALVLAGLQTSAIWMLPVLAGVAGSAFGILYIKSRRN